MKKDESGKIFSRFWVKLYSPMDTKQYIEEQCWLLCLIIWLNKASGPELLLASVKLIIIIWLNKASGAELLLASIKLIILNSLVIQKFGGGAIGATKCGPVNSGPGRKWKIKLLPE